MRMAKPVLYAFTTSSCSWRLRIALAYKGIEHEIRAVRTPDNEHRSAEYLKVNPMGFIPALDINGSVLIESVAIMEYLEEAFPEKPILPKDLFQRAQVRQISQLIACGIQPLQNPNVAQNARPDSAEEQAEWFQFYIRKGFAALETILNKTSANGKYCVGDDLTMADCCLVPQVWNATERYKLDMSPFPTIMEIYRNLYALDEIKSCDHSHPL